MQVFDKQYAKLEANQESKFSLDKIFVDHKGEKVKLSDLYVVKRNNEGKPISRKVRSVSDFKKSLEQNLVFKDPAGKTTDLIFKSTDMFVDVLPKPVPNVHESISLNKTIPPTRPSTYVEYDDVIPYGLKRALKTEQKNADEGKYFYAQLNGEWQFVEADEVHYYDGAEKKSLRDLLKSAPDEVKDKTLFDKDSRTISAIYTEHAYDFPKVLNKEEINLNNLTKTTFNSNGENKIENLETTHSEQEYIKTTVPDEKKPGKTKEISQLKVKNFKVNENGNYYALKINNETKMVDLANIVDANGNEIADIKDYIGSSVFVKEDDQILKTEIVTYEQSVIKYDTVKTYQRVENIATDKTCLRLSDGTYVKELTTVQPKAYALATGDTDDFDCYLVEQTVGGEKKYVVVDREYFIKHGKSAGLDSTKALKLRRCDFNSKNCKVIQTTSKGAKIESCSIVGKIKIGEETLEQADKIEQQKAFLQEYQNGNYDVQDVYLNGEKKELAIGNARYEYTDEIYLNDYSSNTLQYSGMKTKNLELKDGKISGGAKFDVGKSIAKSYVRWGKTLAYGFVPAAAAGIFIPVVGPIAFAAYSAGMIAALPGIPAVTAGIGLIRNINWTAKKQSLSFKDKTHYNRKKLIKQCEKEIQGLYEKGLEPEQFNDAYSCLINKISSLSQTNNKNILVVRDGQAEVTTANANLANKYKKEYNAIETEIKSIDKKLAKLDKKKKLSISKQTEYNALKARKDALNVQLSNLKNVSYGKDYKTDENRDDLISVAQDMRLALFVAKEKESILNSLVEELKESSKAKSLDDSVIEEYKKKVGEILDKVKFSVKDGITINGISLDTPKDELELQNLDKVVWLKIQTAIQNINLEEIKLQEPKSEQVLDKALILKGLAEEIAECYKISDEIHVEIQDIKDYMIKTVIGKQNVELLNRTHQLDTEVKTEDDLAKLQSKLDEVKQTKESAVVLQENLKQVVQILTETKSHKEKFDNIMVNLREEINNLTNANKIKYLKKTNKLDEDVIKILEDVKKATTKEELEQKCEELNNKIEEAQLIIEEVKAQVAKSNIKNATARILELYNLAIEKHAEVKDYEALKIVPNFNEGMKNCISVLKDYKDQSEKADIAKNEIMDLLNKSEKAFKLVEISAKASTIFQQAISNNASKDLKKEIGFKLVKLAGVVEISNKTEYSELENKEKEANIILAEIQVLVATETKEKSKKDENKKNGKEKIAGEKKVKSPSSIKMSAQWEAIRLLTKVVATLEELNDEEISPDRKNVIQNSETYKFFKKLQTYLNRVKGANLSDYWCSTYLDELAQTVEKLHADGKDAQKELDKEQADIIGKCYAYIKNNTTNKTQDAQK